MFGVKARGADGSWSFPRALTELQLHHAVGDKTELSYLRAPVGDQDEDFLVERFPLMKAWATFIDKPSQPASVTSIGPRAIAAG